MLQWPTGRAPTCLVLRLWWIVPRTLHFGEEGKGARRVDNSSPFALQVVPSVLWYCWLGLPTCKNRRPYNLYCVGRDVKPCSINSLYEVSARHVYQFHIICL